MLICKAFQQVYNHVLKYNKNLKYIIYHVMLILLFHVNFAIISRSQNVSEILIYVTNL